MQAKVKRFFDWDVYFKLSPTPLRRSLLGESFGEIFDRVLKEGNDQFGMSALPHIMKMVVKRQKEKMLYYE